MSSHGEFALSEAPSTARKGLLPISMVLFSFTFFTGTMFAGGKLGMAFNFVDMLWIAAIGNGLLIPWITAFQRRNPELFINLTLTLGPMHIIPPECDIRINHGLYPCSNAVIRKLGEMRRMMVASAAYLAKHGVPKTPEDLEFHELLGGNDLVNGAPLVLLKDNERVIVPIHSKLRLKDHTAARTAALFDAGISVHAFRYDTMELVRRKLLIHVLPDWEPEPSPVSLLLPIGRKPSSAVEALCDFIAEKWRSNPELVFDHGL